MATANRADLIQQLYLLCSFNKRQPSSYFRKNQLSPSSIGISPLFTSHPRVLHGSWVRASFACYSKFTLLINSSPGFGSSPCHYVRPFRLAFTLTPQQSCLVNDIELTRWIVLQKARSHRLHHATRDIRSYTNCSFQTSLQHLITFCVCRTHHMHCDANDSYSSLAYGFRYYFISLIGILFTFPSRYSFRYRSLKIFSLGAIVAPASNGISPVPPYLRISSS